MTATAPVIIGMFLGYADARQNNCLPIVCAARLGRQGGIFLLMNGILMMRAGTFFPVMIRMNIFACSTAYYSSNERFPASATRMHIKAYDTQRVP